MGRNPDRLGLLDLKKPRKSNRSRVHAGAKRLDLLRLHGYARKDTLISSSVASPAVSAAFNVTCLPAYYLRTNNMQQRIIFLCVVLVFKRA